VLITRGDIIKPLKIMKKGKAAALTRILTLPYLLRKAFYRLILRLPVGLMHSLTGIITC